MHCAPNPLTHPACSGKMNLQGSHWLRFGGSMMDKLTRADVEGYIRYCLSDQSGTVVELSKRDFLELAHAWLAAQDMAKPAIRPQGASQGLRQAV